MANHVHCFKCGQLIAGHCSRSIGGRRVDGSFRRVSVLTVQAVQEYLADELHMGFAENLVVVGIKLVDFSPGKSLC